LGAGQLPGLSGHELKYSDNLWFFFNNTSDGQVCCPVTLPTA